MTSAELLPVDEHGLIRREGALAAGWSDAMIQSAIRRGELIRMAQGVYVGADPGFVTREGADRLYLMRGIATVTCVRSSGDVVLSHQSAAAVHGMHLLKPDQRRVHVTRNAKSGGGVRGGRHVHALQLSDDDVVEIGGVPTTSAARTAVDVAISDATFAQALTVFDAALARGVPRTELIAQLERRRCHGVRTARRALASATSLSESVGESWSRAQMIEAGIRLPRLQCAHVVEGHEYRSDFDWDCRLVGEFDGRVKYGRLRRPGETVAQSVIREKDREDLLRSAGIMVVRWTWSDLENGLMVPRVAKWLGNFHLLPARSH
ncbi:type IV toxin-antitoxin system AbiEi family antitoxin domain-containing protein [Gordonia neofelifaecis]|uniref:AbiEi antitoxin N-terminal domain-containing protein n=1 Tax=Gordonia neofelifaecis NRRL B-59395 TaxID=644548 RepID=F1YPJ5_9ACTN|nr:type IV toxin-antitoxin system AbiEi family antitoxin domain-containing protein [Gordonia neofelifaecis]EGD53390.1 hypothetical protein SCNU_19250 [Gordonia neofelifaecis NRRL B-59395]